MLAWAELGDIRAAKGDVEQAATANATALDRIPDDLPALELRAAIDERVAALESR